jgi:hypothetical protein
MMLKVLPEPYTIYIKNHTYDAYYFIELFQIVVTLVRCFSYPLDQDHAHSTSFAKFLHQELAHFIHPPNKCSMCYVISLQVFLKKWRYDYSKKKKEGMPISMTKKREKREMGSHIQK